MRRPWIRLTCDNRKQQHLHGKACPRRTSRNFLLIDLAMGTSSVMDGHPRLGTPLKWRLNNDDDHYDDLQYPPRRSLRNDRALRYTFKMVHPVIDPTMNSRRNNSSAYHHHHHYYHHVHHQRFASPSPIVLPKEEENENMKQGDSKELTDHKKMETRQTESLRHTYSPSYWQYPQDFFGIPPPPPPHHYRQHQQDYHHYHHSLDGGGNSYNLLPRKVTPAAKPMGPKYDLENNCGVSSSPVPFSNHSGAKNNSRALGNLDIVCGRGAPTNYHYGNQVFRELMEDHQTSYLCAKRSEKPQIAMKLLDVVKSTGARFVKRQKTAGGLTWIEINDRGAYEKICQALRDGAPGLRGYVALSSVSMKKQSSNKSTKTPSKLKQEGEEKEN